MADGRLCLVIDPEDGTQPLRIWGQNRDEILEKATKTVEHGQRAITQLRSQATTQAHSRTDSPSRQVTSPQTHQPTPNPTQLTDGQRITLTADLNNPAKASAAVTKLIQHETGIDFEKQKRDAIIHRVVTTAQQWENNNPDFPDHPINRKLMMDTATLRVGYENITADVLDDVYADLLAADSLVDAQETTPPPPTVQPPETADTRTVRPRGAASHRRTVTLQAPPAASTTPKYTKEQITAMPSAEYRRKLESDPDFASSVNVLYGQPAKA
jgi:hypothetical protein